MHSMDLHKHDFVQPDADVIFTPSGPTYRKAANSLADRFVAEIARKGTVAAEKLPGQIGAMIKDYYEKGTPFTRPDYVKGVSATFADITKAVVVAPKAKRAIYLFMSGAPSR